MGQLFSKKKKPVSRVTEQDRAVLELKNQRDSLRKMQKKIALQMGREKEVARKFLKDGKKDKAKLLLRKKKFGETQIEKMDVQLDNIEKMVHDLEFAQIEAQVLKGLQAGNESLKQLHKMFDIETVEKIMDETKEAMEYQQEIDDLLSGGLTQQDEDDVLSELEDIIKQSLPSVTEDEHISLPEVPEHEPAEMQHIQREKRKAEALATA